MKQKIVIKLHMDCDKCRNKALKIAAQVSGVTGVSIDGDHSDCVAVTGVNVNTVCLVNMLNKKFSSVVILTVEDLKKVEEAKKKKEEEEKKKKEKMEKLLCSVLCKKCRSSNCHGKCQGTLCSECLRVNCDGKCEIYSIECKGTMCESEWTCNPCSNCNSSNCSGCKPPSPCSKDCSCSKCNVPVPCKPCYPYPYPYYPPQQVVYYDSCPDSICSIM